MAYQSDPSSARSLEVEESHMMEDVPEMARPAPRKLTAAAGMALALVFGGGLVYTSLNQAAMNPVGTTSVDLSQAHTIGPMKAADTMSLPDRPLNPSFTRPLITHDANHNDNHDTHSHSHDHDSNHHKPSKHSHKSNSDVSSDNSDSDSDVSSAHTHSSLPPVPHTSSSSSPSSSSPSPSSSTSRIATAGSPFNTKACEGPFPGYPYCQDRMDWLAANWNKDAATEEYYRANGVDGTNCSFLNFLNLHGFYCPEAIDAAKAKIRGVNLGGWLVLEPWITPSLFKQFDPRDNVADEWRFTEVLGKEEAKRQLQHHWDTWLTEDHIRELADSGINHVRIPFGYWIFGDIRAGEPWVDGELPYLERAIEWCNKYGLHVLLDLHGVPGSQNGFDNSGKRGVVMWADSYRDNTGRVRYPNIERSLAVIRNVTRVFTQPRFRQAVVAIEPVNEAFVSVPLEIVKDYYLQAYEIIKQGTDPLHGYDIAVVIGDSFRFGAWNGFMFPPHYRHVWIDTHIYQVFDTYRLQFSWAEHEKLTCSTNKPEVSVSPLSTLVGEWSLATTDCATWLNGYNVGSRYDGTMYGYTQVGICDGQNDVKSQVFTPEYREFLKEWAALQMDAYESGSSAGWFFWNFRTESAPQWDYLLGLKEGWMPKNHDKRVTDCDTWLNQQASSLN